MPESGVPGYEVSGWFGLLAPAGTPKDVLNKIQSTIADAVKCAGGDEIAALRRLDGMVKP